MSRDAAVPPAGSGVTFVMPVLNEHDYLERAVQTVLAQQFDGPCELVLALGPSTDGTTALARRLAAADDRIRLELAGGRTVMWGSAEDSAEKAEVLAVLLGRDARQIDVSVPGRPTTR